MFTNGMADLRGADVGKVAGNVPRGHGGRQGGAPSNAPPLAQDDGGDGRGTFGSVFGPEHARVTLQTVATGGTDRAPPPATWGTRRRSPAAAVGRAGRGGS